MNVSKATRITLLALAAGGLLIGCGKADKPRATAPAKGAKVPPAPSATGGQGAQAKPATTPTPAAGGQPTTKAGGPAHDPAPVAKAKPAVDNSKRSTAKEVVASAQALAEAGDVAGIAKLSNKMAARGLMRIPAQRLAALLKGAIGEVDVNGGREVVKVTDGGQTKHIVTYNRPGGYELDLMKSIRWQDVDKGEADPLNKPLTLEEATKGIEGTGTLYMAMKTSMGTFNCELFEKQTPKTVANFVGLARGLRGFKDAKTGKWAKRKFYDGLTFHRVIPRFMIQGGDQTGSGSGGIGYTVEDEFDLKLRHDKGGLLSMANRGPNTNSSQFFVTEKDTPWLDDGHTIFGACKEADLVQKITAVPATRTRPNAPVTIESITFSRK